MNETYVILNLFLTDLTDLSIFYFIKLNKGRQMKLTLVRKIFH